MSWNAELLRHAAKMRCSNAAYNLRRHAKRRKEARTFQEIVDTEERYQAFLARLYMDKQVVEGILDPWLASQIIGHRDTDTP